MNIKSPLIATLLLIAPSLLTASSGASISGIVMDENGAPATGVSVTYHTARQIVVGRSGLPTASGSLVSGAVRTAADGTFSTPDLGPGTYYLCAHPAQAGQISACEWFGPDVQVNLQMQNVGGVAFRFVQGTVVTFNVSDPNGKIIDLGDISTNAGMLPLAGANFDLGVFSGRAYRKTVRVSAPAAGRTYQATVPSDNNIRIFLNTELTVTDSSGASVPKGVSSPVADSGQTSVSISLAVH